MTILPFAGKHMKTIHHPPHCDLPIFNGDESSAPKLEKMDSLAKSIALQYIEQDPRHSISCYLFLHQT